MIRARDAATAVRLTDAVPANATLVVGTVQASQGTVVSEDPIEVDLGQIDVGAPATVTFRVLIDVPFPVTSLGVANQATVESSEIHAGDRLKIGIFELLVEDALPSVPSA